MARARSVAPGRTRGVVSSGGGQVLDQHHRRDHGTLVGNAQDFAAWATAGAAKVWAASHPSKRSALVNPTRTRDMCPVFGTHRGRLEV